LSKSKTLPKNQPFVVVLSSRVSGKNDTSFNPSISTGSLRL